MAATRSNAAAARETVKALGKRLRPEHEALKTAVLRLAGQVDDEPTDRLWREYRAALAELLEVADDGDTTDDDGFANSVRTPMGNGAHTN